MLIAGIVLVILGTAGIFTAVGMEVMAGEPIWQLLMKIFPWVVGVGMFLMGLGFARRPYGRVRQCPQRE